MFSPKRLSMALLAGCLSGCAIVDEIHPRSDTVDRSLAESRNQAILLNIVRASHEWPLNFTAIAQVNPGMTNLTSVGLPNFLLGPNPVAASLNRDVIFSNTTLSDNVTVNSNFTVSSLSEGKFYEGLLNPVSLRDLNYLIRQGYPRELLFWLFADTVELSRGSDVIGFHYDPPNDYGCNRRDPKHRCFREWAEIAAITGLTVEAKTVSVKTGDVKGTQEYSRFCFDRVLADQTKRAMDPARRRTVDTYLDRPLTLSPSCGAPGWNPGAKGELTADTLTLRFGPYTFKILTRSTNSIYQFLGRLLRQQRDHIPPSGNAYLAGPEEAEPPTLSTQPGDPELLTIVPKQSSIPCFVHTYFFDGDYCVPEYGAANTKRIFSLLAELLALKTSSSELAITPTVRVVQ